MNKLSIRMLATGLAALLLATGCGGGGEEEEDDDNPAPPPQGPGWAAPPASPAPPAAGSTQTGVFRDANVQGLHYFSGSLAGETGADGRFQYQQGSQVTFRIGGVTLGYFQGQPLITPLHLVIPSSSVGDQIDNHLRFLQMLDQDGNPENGILISDNVRTRAQTWKQVDFTVPPADLPAALEVIRADAISADGGTHTLPTANAARDHFARAARCTYSGIYRGTYSGGDTGVFAIVSYGTGRMRGMGYSTVDHEGFVLEKTTDLQLSFTPDFVAGRAGSAATFSGEYVSPDEIRGNWSSGPDSGTFTGARSGGSDTAVYRLAGYQFPLGTALIMQFDISAANEVTGSVIDLDAQRDGVPVSLTGTLNGTAFSAQSPGGQYSATGTFNPAAAGSSLVGAMRDNVKGRDVSLNIPACKLN